MRMHLWVCAVVIAALFCSLAQAGLVTYWSFDSDFAADAGGAAFDLTSFNGATAGDAGGAFGNAATFERDNEEYAFTTGNVLTQGPGQDHSYSAWYLLDVADITGSSRYFVLETTAGDAPSGDAAWSASYGLRDLSGVDSGQVYSRTDSGDAPNVDFDANGNQVWHSIIVTYDADGGANAGEGRHDAYLDGTLVGTFDNVDPLEAVEGLVIGGHRAGTGRNFNGQVDAVSFYNHVLSSGEIGLLQSNPVVPEPSTLALLGFLSGLGVLGGRRRRGVFR